MELKLKNTEGKEIGTIDLSELEEKLKASLNSSLESNLADIVAKLKEKDDRVTLLEDKIVELEDPHHKRLVAAEILKGMDAETYMNLGIKLGHAHLFVSEPAEVEDTDEGDGSEWQGFKFSDTIPEGEDEDDWTWVPELAQYAKTGD